MLTSSLGVDELSLIDRLYLFLRMDSSHPIADKTVSHQEMFASLTPKEREYIQEYWRGADVSLSDLTNMVEEFYRNDVRNSRPTKARPLPAHLHGSRPAAATPSWLTDDYSNPVFAPTAVQMDDLIALPIHLVVMAIGPDIVLPPWLFGLASLWLRCPLVLLSEGARAADPAEGADVCIHCPAKGDTRYHTSSLLFDFDGRDDPEVRFLQAVRACGLMAPSLRLNFRDVATIVMYNAPAAPLMSSEMLQVFVAFLDEPTRPDDFPPHGHAAMRRRASLVDALVHNQYKEAQIKRAFIHCTSRSPDAMSRVFQTFFPELCEQDLQIIHRRPHVLDLVLTVTRL